MIVPVVKADMRLSNPVESFFTISNYLYPRVAPDEGRIAVFGDQTGQHELYVVDIETGELTHIDVGEALPNPSPNTMVWTPDGDALYVMKNEFVSGYTESETATPIFRLFLDGDAEHVTSIDGNCRLWAVNPKTGYLYYQYNNGLHYYDPSAEDHGTFPAYPSFCHFGGGGPSPDGNYVAYTSDPLDNPHNSNIYIAAPDGSDARKLDISEDGRKTAAQAWHPDGQRLLVNEDVDRDDRTSRMGIYDLEANSIEWIADARGIAFVTDGEAILSGDDTIIYDFNGAPCEIDISGVARFDPLAAENAITEYGFVVRRKSETRPWEIIYHNLSENTTRVLVESDFGDVDPDGIVEPEDVTYELRDGEEADGVLFDSGERPSSAVVRIYGAREAPDRLFNPATQLLVYLGYTVFIPGFPGEPFTDAEHEAFAAAGKWLKARDWIDDDRIAVFGHSHGGYDVYMQTVQYPEVWTGAIASSGMVDLLAVEEQDAAPYLYWDLGNPEENADRWRAQSPIEYVNEETLPLLIVHGEEDYLPIEQPRQFVSALKEHGWEESEDFLLEELEEYGHMSTASEDEQHKWRKITEFLEEIF